LEPLRILHCPGLVGGHPPTVARHERALGLDSHCVAFRETPFGYPADEVLAPPGTSAWRFELRRLHLLWRALHDFDVVHFNFGRTLLPDRTSWQSLEREGAARPVLAAYGVWSRWLELRDLAWLRHRGKIVCVTFQGDDVRRGDLLAQLGRTDLLDELEPGYYSTAGDTHRRRVAEAFGQHADALWVLNPDLLYALPDRARFLPYASVDIDEWKPEPRPIDPHAVPLVVHAPTHRHFKGTRFVEAAVAQLRSEGLRFEFQCVEAVTREAARRIYQRANLFVDQLLIGWYGGAALELMALGKPVVCRLRDEDLARVPAEMAREMPIVRAGPGDLTDVLREWIRAPAERRAELGRASRRFAERWHDPRRIAGILRASYEQLHVGSVRPNVRNSADSEMEGLTG